MLCKPFIKQCVPRPQKLYLPLNATVPSGAETAAAEGGVRGGRRAPAGRWQTSLGLFRELRSGGAGRGEARCPGGGRSRHAGGEFLNGAAHAHSGGARDRGPRPPRTCGSPRRAFPAGRPRPAPRHWLPGPPRAGVGGAIAARRAAPPTCGGASTHPARSRRINQRGASCALLTAGGGCPALPARPGPLPHTAGAAVAAAQGFGSTAAPAASGRGA